MSACSLWEHRYNTWHYNYVTLHPSVWKLTWLITFFSFSRVKHWINSHWHIASCVMLQWSPCISRHFPMTNIQALYKSSRLLHATKVGWACCFSYKRVDFFVWVFNVLSISIIFTTWQLVRLYTLVTVLLYACRYVPYVFSQVMEEKRDCTTNATTNSSTVNTNMLHPYHTMYGVQPPTSEDKPSYVVYKLGTVYFISLTITLHAQILIWKFSEICINSQLINYI